MNSDLRAAVDDHAAAYNEAVRSGNYSAFLATFADDAVMRFTNVPVGPFHGRAQITEAYLAQPPTSTLTVRSISEIDPATARVAVDYDSGDSGVFTVRWRDGQVADLEITFD